MLSILYHVDEFVHFPGQVVQLLLSPMNKPIEFQAGQYLFLMSSTGRQMPYSIANAPCEDGRIELHIRQKNQDNDLSQLLSDLENTRQAEIVSIAGSCIYPDKKTPLILLAGGTGFAQMKSLIEHAIQCRDDRVIHLFWAITRLDDAYLMHLLKDWKKQLKNFNYTVVCAQRIDSDDANIFSGLIYDAVLSSKIGLSDSQVIASGPFSMVEDCFYRLKEQGLTAEGFYSDVFMGE